MVAITGEGDDYSSFVREHTRGLLGTAYLLTRSSPAAEELVQDTLVRLYAKWQQVAAADSSIAYVRRAIINNFLNDRRRQQATREVSYGTLPDLTGGSDFTTEFADRDLIWQLLATLPDRQRAAVVLRFFHDFDDATIAEQLSCRRGTVRSLTSRALAALRDQVRTAEAMSDQAEGRRG